MAVEGAIFDLGHTLMYLDGTWPEVVEQGIADLGRFLSGRGVPLDGPAFARALHARRLEGFVRAEETRREVTAEESMRSTFAALGRIDPDPELVRGAIDAFFAYEDSRWAAYPEAQAVLSELAGRGLRLGMFSNATHDPFIQRLVDRFGFRAWLQPALSSAGTGIRKPDPAAFGPILAAWNLPAEAVVMVGDTLEADILGARLAGMRSIWFRSRDQARQEGEGKASQVEEPAGDPPSSIVPDATIDRLADLPGCLASM